MTARTAALLVAGLALARGVVVAAVIPPFHGPDEPAHFDFAQRLAESRALPSQAPGCEQYSPEVRAAVDSLVRPIQFHPERKLPPLSGLALPPSRHTEGCGSAATYPPLYYTLGALYYSARAGAPLLARVHAVRLLSICLGALAAALVLIGAHALFGDLRAALAVALAFTLQPQLAMLFSVVNSDAALFAASAGALCAIARRSIPGLAIAALLGALSKATMLVHLPALFVLAVAVFGWWRAALALVPAAMAGGAWALWRGAPFSVVKSISLTDYLGEALTPKHLRFTWLDQYWMAWGWVDTWLRRPWYLAAAALALLALAAAMATWRKLDARDRGLLVIGALATAVSLATLHALEFRVQRGTGFLQGRYLLPLFPLHAAMLVAPLRRSRLAFVIPLFLGAMLFASVLRAIARYGLT